MAVVETNSNMLVGLSDENIILDINNGRCWWIYQTVMQHVTKCVLVDETNDNMAVNVD